MRSYSVKSGNHLGCNLLANPSSSGIASLEYWWKFLWCINIPSKVKLFIWRACPNWIPARYNLAKRGMHMEINCLVCGKCLETTVHALWACPALKQIRSTYHCLGGFGVKDNMQFLDLMILCINKLLQEEFELICIIIWRIWCRWNELVHGKPALVDREAVLWARAFLNEYRRANDESITLLGFRVFF
ncbi:hypothetical protein Dsin_023559 [Dipteronia sinensis]|uniref:Reverse transcriptase zinc-binding domain-containing protein n=1 Tax=Dipteronia sinensis TaxID=43782 RepID=A0AAE0A4N1_9ROSI|nr:hypothetical protein Dsin_023559 [Dipteronia sinensis]